MTPENRHAETDAGDPQGREAWQLSPSYVPASGDLVWLDADDRLGAAHRLFRRDDAALTRVFEAGRQILVDPLDGAAARSPPLSGRQKFVA